MPEIVNKVTDQPTKPLRFTSVKSSTLLRVADKSQRRRRNVPSYEFMAAAVGDVEWLNQSLSSQRATNDAKDVGSTYDANGMAPLHLAAANCHLNCIRLLIEQYGVAVDLPNKSGYRSTHLCLRCDNAEQALSCLRYLLAMGADPSVMTDDGITPLHIAASQGNLPCLRLLLDAGAAVDATDGQNRTPHDLSRIYGHKDCSRLLSSAQWSVDKRNAALAEQRGEIDRIRQLVDKLDLQQELEQERLSLSEQAFRDWLHERRIDGGRPIPDDAPSCRRRHDVDPRQSAVDESKTTEVDANDPACVDRCGSSARKSSASPASGGSIGRWLPSTRPPPKPYVPILGDYYPRDEVTKLPAPPLKRRTLSPAMKLAIKQRRHQIANRGSGAAPSKSTGLGRAELKSMLETAHFESLMSSKPAVFKPSTVLDVAKRRSFNPETVRRAEVPLHLLETDTSSLLFRAALLPSCRQVVYGSHLMLPTVASANGGESAK